MEWECPHDWLYDKMREKFAEEDRQWIRVFFWSMACQLGDDQIRGIFERAMDADGYFEEVDDA